MAKIHIQVRMRYPFMTQECHGVARFRNKKDCDSTL